jgi:hypothetical protein
MASRESCAHRCPFEASNKRRATPVTDDVINLSPTKQTTLWLRSHGNHASLG